MSFLLLSNVRRFVGVTWRLLVAVGGPLAQGTAVIVAVPALIGSGALMPGGAAHAQSCGILQNYTGAGTVACPCFIVGEEAGVVLNVPAADYPIEILKIAIGWGSQFGGNPQQLEQAIHLYPAGLPNPGAPQFSLVGPQLTDGVINVFDISLIPGNKIINAGPFSITLEFLNQNAGNFFASSVVHDGNGCQGGLNLVKAIPGGWSDACVLGVTGDWVMYVEYRSTSLGAGLNCPSSDGTGLCPAPPNRSPDISADGVVDLVDLAVFALNYPPNPYAQCSDFDANGLVDLVDLSIFAQHFGHAGGQIGVCN